jgi:hypothetical protein
MTVSLQGLALLVAQPHEADAELARYEAPLTAGLK